MFIYGTGTFIGKEGEEEGYSADTLNHGCNIHYNCSKKEKGTVADKLFVNVRVSIPQTPKEKSTVADKPIRYFTAINPIGVFIRP